MESLSSLSVKFIKTELSPPPHLILLLAPVPALLVIMDARIQIPLMVLPAKSRRMMAIAMKTGLFLVTTADRLAAVALPQALLLLLLLLPPPHRLVLLAVTMGALIMPPVAPLASSKRTGENVMRILLFLVTIADRRVDVAPLLVLLPSLLLPLQVALPIAMISSPPVEVPVINKRLVETVEKVG